MARINEHGEGRFGVTGGYSGPYGTAIEWEAYRTIASPGDETGESNQHHPYQTRSTLLDWRATECTTRSSLSPAQPAETQPDVPRLGTCDDQRIGNIRKIATKEGKS